MLLLAGLGNPGAKYSGNRHNIGFMAVDEIARAHGFSPWRKKFQSEFAEGSIDGVKCLLLSRSAATSPPNPART
jgi:PTH1 family peptidyl-tRNA hydrolase